uniref:LEM domain-containing protein n=1 Tax=Panagrellus redivivus TaxID=6233 RepID=A0A7E4V217_PANRE
MSVDNGNTRGKAEAPTDPLGHQEDRESLSGGSDSLHGGLNGRTVELKVSELEAKLDAETLAEIAAQKSVDNEVVVALAMERVTSVDACIAALRDQIAVANEDLQKMKHPAKMIDAEEISKANEAMKLVRQLPAAIGVMALQRKAAEDKLKQFEMAMRQVCEIYGVESVDRLHDYIDNLRHQIDKLKTRGALRREEKPKTVKAESVFYKRRIKRMRFYKIAQMCLTAWHCSVVTTSEKFIAGLSDKELREKLLAHGAAVGPVIGTSRHVSGKETRAPCDSNNTTILQSRVSDAFLSSRGSLGSNSYDTRKSTYPSLNPTSADRFDSIVGDTVFGGSSRYTDSSPIRPRFKQASPPPSYKKQVTTPLLQRYNARHCENALHLPRRPCTDCRRCPCIETKCAYSSHESLKSTATAPVCVPQNMFHRCAAKAELS